MAPNLDTFFVGNDHRRQLKLLEVNPENSSFIVVEFDTNLDTSRNDNNGNHVGIDINSLNSWICYYPVTDKKDHKCVDPFPRCGCSVKRDQSWEWEDRECVDQLSTSRDEGKSSERELLQLREENSGVAI